MDPTNVIKISKAIRKVLLANRDTFSEVDLISDATWLKELANEITLEVVEVVEAIYEQA